MNDKAKGALTERRMESFKSKTGNDISAGI